MKEFDGYDKMMTEYYTTMDVPATPLSSWEFYGEHNTFLQICKHDLEVLERISKKWDFNNIYHKELVFKRTVIVVTTADIKIVHATNNIKKMTGFSPEEVIGKSPKMFQGKKTDVSITKLIREAIDKQESFDYSIVNYKKDNSSYLCRIKCFPVKDKKGKLVNYIAFEHAA